MSKFEIVGHRAKDNSRFGIGMSSGSLYFQSNDGSWICISSKGPAIEGSVLRNPAIDILPIGTEIKLVT